MTRIKLFTLHNCTFQYDTEDEAVYMLPPNTRGTGIKGEGTLERFLMIVRESISPMSLESIRNALRANGAYSPQGDYNCSICGEPVTGNTVCCSKQEFFDGSWIEPKCEKCCKHQDHTYNCVGGHEYYTLPFKTLSITA